MERTKSFILSSKINSYNLAQVCTFQPMAREYNYIFLFLYSLVSILQSGKLFCVAI